jgi:pimeloyl-ACP methyl ester carboxylesterase
VDDAPEPVAQDALDDLRLRLESTRRVRVPAAEAWTRGVDVEYLYDLVEYWAHDYDWRASERRIRALPWRVVTVGEQSCRVVCHESTPEMPTVVLLHGWPDSVLRFERVLPLLTDFNVVVPALPGFPFAPPTTGPGMSTVDLGAVVTGIMAALGCHRYVVSGGDVGSWVAHAMAAVDPNTVAALHLTDVPYEYLVTLPADELTADERTARVAAQRWRDSEGAYDAMQATKPHTLAVGLGDSPAGLLAWIVEKLHGWSDCSGDVESVFPRDDLLTWVSAYWFTNSIGTSMAPYAETPGPFVTTATPTVVTSFPLDIPSAPESFARRFFDVRAWDRAPRGGHFAAWEVPELYAAGVRAAVNLAEGTDPVSTDPPTPTA